MQKSARQKKIDECEEQFPPYAEEMGRLQEEWDIAHEMVFSSTIMALWVPVGQLEIIHREASSVEPPVCVTSMHEIYLHGMSRLINIFLGIISDSNGAIDAILDMGEFKLASLNMSPLKNKLERYKKEPTEWFNVLREIAAVVEADETEIARLGLELEEWITTAEAAELSGYHFNYIRQIIRAGKLEARKFGPLWQVNRTALLEYIEDAKDSGDLRRGPKD